MSQMVRLIDEGEPRDHRGNEPLKPAPSHFHSMAGFLVAGFASPWDHQETSASLPGSPWSAVPMAMSLKSVEFCFQRDEALALRMRFYALCFSCATPMGI